MPTTSVPWRRSAIYSWRACSREREAGVDRPDVGLQRLDRRQPSGEARQQDRLPEPGAALEDREIDERARRLGHPDVLAVLRHPHDFEEARRLARLQAFPDGILPGPEAAGERLVDDRDQRRSLAVPGREVTAGKERGPEGLEVAGGSRVDENDSGLAGIDQRSFGSDRVSDRAAGQRKCLREGGREDAGIRLDPCEQGPEELLALLGRVALGLQVEGRGQHTRRACAVEADVHRGRFLQAAEEEARRREEHEGDRDLGYHEPALETRAGVAALPRALVLQRRDELAPRGLP